MSSTFAKYEGLGNDFVVVEGPLHSAQLRLAAEHAVQICDRHRGVGADGVLLVEHAGSEVAMRVINPDGSRPEMCGNGIRCVALHLVRTAARDAGTHFVIETDAGPHTCRVERSGSESLVEVAMRAASLEPETIPVVAERPVLDEPFELAGRRVRFSCVSMGNPHAVTFDALDQGAGDARASLGPLFAKHPRFPNGANIGFARVVAPQTIELAVYERGAGFTQACGTGACACAVAAVATGRAARATPIEIRLPGGSLRIVVGELSDNILMTGPARHVFDGTFARPQAS
jgi:diaminopimelate epimerase